MRSHDGVRGHWKRPQSLIAQQVAAVEPAEDRLDDAAIETVFDQLRKAAGGLNASTVSFEYAMRTLKAGRAGS